MFHPRPYKIAVASNLRIGECHTWVYETYMAYSPNLEVRSKKNLETEMCYRKLPAIDSQYASKY